MLVSAMSASGPLRPVHPRGVPQGALAGGAETRMLAQQAHGDGHAGAGVEVDEGHASAESEGRGDELGGAGDDEDVAGSGAGDEGVDEDRATAADTEASVSLSKIQSIRAELQSAQRCFRQAVAHEPMCSDSSPLLCPVPGCASCAAHSLVRGISIGTGDSGGRSAK